MVEEATDGARLEIGKIYLAPGGERHLQVSNASAPCCRLVERARSTDIVLRWMSCLIPSQNSLAGNAVGVILTGMGRDGASAY